MISLIKLIDHMILMTPPDQSEKDQKKEAFANFADSLIQAEKDDEQAKKDILRKGIAKREKKQKGEIESSRAITKLISELREKADLSPFVGTSGKIKSPRLRRGEFIEILSRELLYIGSEEMKETGGVVSLKHLRTYFQQKRDNWELRDQDIPEAIDHLLSQQLIANREEIEGEIIVYFQAIELSSDPKQLVEASLNIEATHERLLMILGWSEARLQQAIDQLVEDGIAIDDGTQVYFPGLS
jgi:hypothetical protein